MIAIASILAGLLMLVTQGFSILRSLSSGVIISKSYGAARIERAEDRERFDKLIKQRAAGLTPGLLLILFGLVLPFLPLPLP